MDPVVPTTLRVNASLVEADAAASFGIGVSAAKSHLTVSESENPADHDDEGDHYVQGDKPWLTIHVDLRF